MRYFVLLQLKLVSHISKRLQEDTLSLWVVYIGYTHSPAIEVTDSCLAPPTFGAISKIYIESIVFGTEGLKMVSCGTAGIYCDL